MRDEFRRRVNALRPDTARRWGRMTVDQMLWHVNTVLRESLGEYTAPPSKPPMPRPLLKWLVLNIPWPRGARTRPDLVAATHHDFDAQRSQTLELIDRFHAKELGVTFPRSENFGEMSGRDWSRLHAKHLDHHLRQFGV